MHRHILVLSMALLAGLSGAAEQECASVETAEGASFFPGIPAVKYAGPDSKDLFSYRYYNAEEVILGKPMKDWLRFSVAFWHTLRGDGSDMFGKATKQWPWEDASLSELDMALKRLRVMFELLDKLGLDYWAFHDRDIAPNGADLKESNDMLDVVAAEAERLMKKSSKKVLWGTAQLFVHPRFMHGAATSPNATVFAYSAAQVKACMDVTHRLKGEGFVFWGGREGYFSLLNTDMKTELDNLASFLRMAVDYKKKIGATFQLMLEPKPQEPTKHQYDYDAATTIAFLKHYGLDKHFKLNLETNHAQLAGHSMEHEMQTAIAYGLLGSLDANTGDPQTGWDTDQFLTDPLESTRIALAIVKNGGLAPGGVNFDAKLRRESTDVADLFYAHISGIDALAFGLRKAAAIIEDGRLPGLVEQRYSSYSKGIGKKIRNGKVGFEELSEYALTHPDPIEDLPSGSIERYEIIQHQVLTAAP